MHAQPDTLWSRDYGEEGRDACYSVKQTDDGGFILGGHYGQPREDDRQDCFVVRTDSEGEEIWSNIFGGDDFDQCRSLFIAGDASYVISGYTESFGAGSDDGYVIKIDSEGEEIWSQTYGDIGSERFYTSIESSDSSYIFGGFTSS